MNKTAAEERAAYAPTLEEDLRHCLDEMQENEMVFQYETRPELVEACIYTHAALECRYAYLLRQARAVGLRGSV